MERAKIKSSEALADRIGVGFTILPESQEDAEATRLVEFDAGDKAVMMQRLKEIKSGNLFAAAKSAPKNQHQQKNWSRVATTGGGVTGGRSGIGGLPKKSTLVAATGASGSGSGSDKDRIVRSLASTVKANTQLQVDPFLNAGSSASSKSSSALTATPPLSSSKPLPLVAYGDDDDDDDDD